AEFLTSQREDLEEARQHEMQIIQELSRKSRENFLETFNAVRKHFQELVRKLFGGGSGDIMLDDEAGDVLDAGIEIRVQPPGKENRSITLLSGGEKALAAVALLFSIFESKPSPFCLLDEVDAPLDEANVGRFLGMLQEYAEDTQFVMVTHNKTTMSAAETLYGISLQEDGVSKKVAVNFEEVDNKLEEMTRETRMAEMRAKAG
ncbi:MAG: AAA family ATPase, partial [Planctomycetota bacterium]